MDLGLGERVAIVTGGSRGIGRAIALGLAEEGVHVAICARGAGALEEARKQIEARGVRAVARSLDVADGEALDAFVDETAAELGRIDVLVNNASGFGMADVDAEWRLGFEVDVLAASRASRRAIPWLERSDLGSIVFLSSTAALEAPGPPAYSAMKAALLSYSKNLAIELAPRGVRVNVVAPGSIEFPGGLWEQTRREQPERYEAIRASIPSGRLGSAEEVADCVVFLASARARWVTGAVLAVDGGQHKGIL